MLKISCLTMTFLVLATSGSVQGQTTEERLVRGNYLANGPVACANCHMPRDNHGQPLYDQGLSGGMRIDDPMFTAFAPNITPDKKTGIGLWTDAQLAKAIREGVRPDGSIIGPPMPIPFHRNLSDDDLAALVAYLKAQPAVEHLVEKSVYQMPLPSSYGPPVQGVKTPSATDVLVYGRYIADISHCMDCHTPRNNKGQLEHVYEGAGGQVFKGPWGESVARNLTQDATGLKQWTPAQIETAIRQGLDRDGAHYHPPMAFTWYANINDTDMAALLAYLQSLPSQPFGGKK